MRQHNVWCVCAEPRHVHTHQTLSYMSIHYQIWHHILRRSIYSPILRLPHDLDDGVDRMSLNVGNSLSMYAAYIRRRAKV